jgi:hypothetical protein
LRQSGEAADHPCSSESEKHGSSVKRPAKAGEHAKRQHSEQVFRRDKKMRNAVVKWSESGVYEMRFGVSRHAKNEKQQRGGK